MAIPLTPLPLQGFDLEDQRALKIWQSLVANAINQMQTVVNQIQDPAFLSNVVSTATSGGNVSTDQTLNTAGIALISATYTNTAASTRTLTMTNLAQGTFVSLRLSNTSGGSQLWKVVGSTPTEIFFVSINGVTTNLTTTGISVTTGIGISMCGAVVGGNVLLVGG